MKGLFNKFFGPQAAAASDTQPNFLVPLCTDNLHDNQKRALIGWIANRIAQKLRMDRVQAGSLIYLSFVHDDSENKAGDENHRLLSIASRLVAWMLNDEDVYLNIKELKLADNYYRCLLETYEEIKVDFFRYLAADKAPEKREQSAEDDIWQVYRDVIYAATQRKFLLIKPSEVAAYAAGKVVCEAPVVERSDIPKAREQAKQALSELDVKPAELMSCLLVISEAITNILKHAREGKMLIVDAGSSLHILVADKGPGFHLKILPNTVLMAGYSTKKSLGQGFTLMMKMTELVLLSTVPNEGSTLILVFNRLAKEGEQGADKH